MQAAKRQYDLIFATDSNMSKSRAAPARQDSAGGGIDDDGGGNEMGADHNAMPEIELPNPFVLMPNILEKLKILDYESKFAREMMNGDLLHSAYFAVPHPKPNEQFYYFVSLFSWLMKLNRFQFNRPDQFDDPNTTVTEVVDALRKARLQVDYPAAKVKQGHGEAVCQILDLLCDGALENASFRMLHPVYPADTYPEEAPIDEDEEVSADVDDKIGVAADDDDDDVYQPQKGGDKGAGKEAADNKIMESKTDPTAWMVEVENVAPLLKMRVEADNKEWRTHLETTKDLQGNINQKTGGTKESLTKLSTSISGSIERIQGREKTLNSTYKAKVSEYHEIQERLTEVSKRYDDKNGAVADLTNQLTDITDQLETIRSQMEERGDSMTDTGPLVKIQGAMKTIKKEITSMDLRIGTVAQNLLHIKLAEQSSKENDRGGNKSDDDD